MHQGESIEKFNYTNIKGYSEQELADIVKDLCASAEDKDTAISNTISYFHNIIA